MASLIGRISQLARSPKGREMMERAQRMAKDPATRQKIADARQRAARKR